MKLYCLCQQTKLYFQDKPLCLASNQDLFLIRTFNAQPVKLPHFKSLLTPKQARWPHFLLHFYNVHIMNVYYAKFQKTFDSRTISRELPYTFCPENLHTMLPYLIFNNYSMSARWIWDVSIYTLSDLGVLSNLIGSLSLANEHYSPPTEWIMRKPNKNKMAGVNSRFASVSESIFNGFLLKMLLRSLPVYILKQLFSQSRWIVAEYLPQIFCHYSPRFQRIIVK